MMNMVSFPSISTWCALVVVATMVTSMPVATTAIHDIRYSEWRDHQAGRQNLTAPKVLQQHDDDEVVVPVSSQMESLFPQLDITLAPPTSKNMTSSRVPLHPNSFEPTYFESSLFEGKVLLVFPHKDEYELQQQQQQDTNDEKQTTKYIDIQIQGKFKRVPKGTIYFGVQFDTYIGGWKKWIAKMIFKLIQAFAPIKFSYGNEKSNELPYVTSPLEYNAETYIATPPTEIPPTLGRSLVREKNINTDDDGNGNNNASSFNTIDTYTFRFSNPCFDLVEWQFSLGDYKINLEDMLGTSNVNLIAYEHNDDNVNKGSSSSDDDYYQMFFATVQPYHERVIQLTTN